MFRRVDPRVVSVGLVGGEPEGGESCWEMSSVVQRVVAGGDVTAIGFRKGDRRKRHDKARTKEGLRDIEGKDKKFLEVW